MNLELMAMRWLWLEKMCHYILEQRTPRPCGGIPDVIGITKTRFLIEIEIKRSVADFRADKKKSGVRCRETADRFYADQFPKYFYYFMPKKIADKVMDEIPVWAGLIVVDENDHRPTVVKKAPSNKESKRITLKECVRAVRLMCNHMMTTEIYLETHKNRFVHKDTVWFTQWIKAEVGTYEI